VATGGRHHHQRLWRGGRSLIAGKPAERTAAKGETRRDSYQGVRGALVRIPDTFIVMPPLIDPSRDGTEDSADLRSSRNASRDPIAGASTWRNDGERQ